MKIAVLLSGGVDSSVALKLLKEQGHNLTAFYLKIWLEDELSFLGKCPWEEDLEYARKVCKQFDVPLKVISMQKEYFDNIVSYTISEIKNGRTPNPDIFCNKIIKFGLFLDKIDKKFEKVATGHYAQITKKNETFLLKKTPDPIKDQTYFLARLSQKQLSRAIFPIGNLTKQQVRDLAEQKKLPNKNRKDSQGICFLGKLKFDEFLKHYLDEQKGDLIEYESKEKVGEHPGFWYFTIGQRKNIRLAGGPWYVVDKNPKKNQIFISKKYHDPKKKRNKLEVADFNWFEGKNPKQKNLQVKLRHGEHFYNCEIKYNKDSATITLDADDQGIAPGQFAVFYDQEICLGSAMIIK
ncbi:tRNA 2-thiouridine(34) synthase MnmA [Patescibacteria group bacterium]